MQTQIQRTSIISDVTVTIPASSSDPNTNAKPFNGDMRSIQAVDLNGDGYLDIFIHPSYYNQGQALAPIVLLNDGHGGFIDGTKAVFKTLPIIEQSNGVFFKSFTNDGRIGMFVIDQGLEIGDAYVGGFKGAKNQFWLQDKNGVFQDLTANLPNNDPAFNHVSSVADINGDGNLDILVTRLGGPAVEGSGTFFYLGDGKGNFAFSTAGLPEEIKYDTNAERDWSSKTVDYQFSGSAGAGDLNNTGRQDLITGSYTGGDSLTSLQTIRVYQHQPDNNFAKAFQTTEPDALIKAIGVMGIAGIVTGDLNGDGLQDIVIHWETGAKSAIEVLQNMGNYQFNDVTFSTLGSYLIRDAFQKDSTGNYQPLFSLAILKDVNHDGKLDLVLNSSQATGQQLVNGLSTGAFVYLNDGAGHFSAAIPAASDGSILSTQQLDTLTGRPDWGFGIPLVFDANHDGKSDYVFVNADKNSDGTTALHIATLLGNETGSIYKASNLGDTLVGSSGNDTFYGGKGNDILNGGEGIDTTVYADSRSNFTITKTDTGFTVVNTARTEGTDTLINIERIKFADSAIALDINGVAGEAFRLYQAAFDRTPDLSGLGYWINDMDKGSSLTSVAAGFFRSPEFQKLYGANPSTTTLITNFYQNVLHRAPDQAGFDYWVNQLDSGMITAPGALASFCESAENQAALIGVMQNGIEYTSWHG